MFTNASQVCARRELYPVFVEGIVLPGLTIVVHLDPGVVLLDGARRREISTITIIVLLRVRLRPAFQVFLVVVFSLARVKGIMLGIEVRINIDRILRYSSHLVGRCRNHVLLLLTKSVKARHGLHPLHLPHVCQLVKRLTKGLLKGSIVLPVRSSVTLERRRVHTCRNVDDFAFLGDAGPLINFA